MLHRETPRKAIRLIHFLVFRKRKGLLCSEPFLFIVVLYAKPLLLSLECSSSRTAFSRARKPPQIGRSRTSLSMHLSHWNCHRTHPIRPAHPSRRKAIASESIAVI